MKSLIKMLALISLSISLSCCAIFDNQGDSTSTPQASDSGEETKEEQLFNDQTFGSGDWVDINSMGQHESKYVVIAGQTGGNINFKLTNFPSSYKNLKISISVRNPRASSSITYTFAWPTNNETGEATSTSYTYHCGAKSGAAIAINGINGFVRQLQSCKVSSDGGVYSFGHYPEETSPKTYSYCGQDKTIEEKCFRLPNSVGNLTLDTFGFGTFDIFGFDNVESVIIPATYLNIKYNESWKSFSNVKYLFYEGDDDSVSTVLYYRAVPNMELIFYSETAPTNNIRSHWHYVDGVPTIW